MGRTLSEAIAGLSRERREKIKERASKLIAEEMSLRDLRKAMGRTQAKVAEDLGVGQDTVSRIEQRADMLLSTIEQYVEKMGGRLTLMAEFPDRDPVRIKRFGEIIGKTARKLPHRAKSVKLKRKVRKSGDSAKAVERAVRRAARSARKTARMHGTPIYVWEKGKVVAIKP